MRGSQTREIDGRVFEAAPLLPFDGLKVLTRLSKIIGEPLGLAGKMLLASGGEGAEAEPAEPAAGAKAALDRDMSDGILGEVLAKVIGAITDRLDENEVIDTVRMLLKNVQVQGEGDKGTRRLTVDVDFAGGQTLSLLKVTYFALEVNFADFLSGSGASALIARAQAAGGRFTRER